jgi:outer membrane protein assembly factor BamB
MQRWQLRSPQGVFPPAAAAGIAYVGGRDGSLRALALADGKVLWRHDYGGWLYTPAIVGERLIVGGRERVLRSFDTRSGKLRWQKQLTQELVYRPVAVAGERVVVTLFDGTILMVDASDGHTLWQMQERTPNFPPAVSAGALYFGSFDGKLHARAVADGRILWQQRVGGRLHLLPQLANAAVLVANDQGQVVAYEAATGRKLWGGFAAHEPVASPVVLNGEVLAFVAGGAYLGWRVPFLTSSKPNLPRSATQ